MQRSLASLLLVLVLGLSGCGGEEAPTIAGVWQASDGSGTKTIQDSGACEGMYYNQGKPLDIGGGMTCSMGEEADAEGRYTLVVSQPPNQTTYELEFDGDNDVIVFQDGHELLRLKRL